MCPRFSPGWAIALPIRKANETRPYIPLGRRNRGFRALCQPDRCRGISWGKNRSDMEYSKRCEDAPRARQNSDRRQTDYRVQVRWEMNADREFWRWLESPEQLPAFEKALWEERALAEERRGVSPVPLKYFQLTVESSPLVVAEQTILMDPFFGGLQHHCKCEFGEVFGRIFSQLYVKGSSWDGADICQTDLYFGGRQGLFRPYRQLIVSKRLFEAMRQSKITKVAFEIVEMV